MRFIAVCLMAVCCVCAHVAAPAHAQNAALVQTSELSVEEIMRDPDITVGNWPENVRWHENGQVIYFDWNPGGEYPSDSLFSYNVATGEAPAKVSPTNAAAHRRPSTGGTMASMCMTLAMSGKCTHETATCISTTAARTPLRA